MTVTTAMIKDLREMTGAGPLDCKKALESTAGDFDQAATFLRERGFAKAAKKADRETKAGLVVIKELGSSACAVEINCETDFVAFTKDFKIFAHRLADQVLADAELTDATKLLAADFIDAPGQSTADVMQQLIGKLDENIILRRVVRYTLDGFGLLEGYVHAGDLEGHYGPMEGRLGALLDLRVADAAAVNNTLLQELAHDLTLQIVSSQASYPSPDDIPVEVVDQQRQMLIDQVRSENKPDHIKEKIVEGQLRKFFQDTCLIQQAFVKDENLSVQELLQHKSRELGTSITIKRFARFEVGA